MARNDVAEECHQILNAFPVVLPTGTTLSYRIWEVDPIPDTLKLREKIRSHLWQRKLHRPVVPIRVDDHFAYAAADWGKQEPVEYAGEGERRYIIRPTDEVRTVELSTPEGAEAELASAMLQAGISLSLRSDQRLAHGHRSDQFFLLTPDEPFETRSLRDKRAPQGEHADPALDIFRGFTFRVIPVEGVGLCLVLDVLTSYIGRDTLATYISRRAMPRAIETDSGLTRWVNDYGRIKQSVYLLRNDHRTIGQIVLKDGQTVDKHLLAKYPWLAEQVSATDQAAIIIYKVKDRDDESKYYHADTALLKPKFTTESPEVRASGDTPAFPPAERLRRIREMLPYFQGVRFAGQQMALEPALGVPGKVFRLPDLLFGSPEAPEVLRAASSGGSDDEFQTRSDWGVSKLKALQEHGPHRQKPFFNPCVVYPASMEESGLLDAFLKLTKNYCDEYGKEKFEPHLDSYRDNAHARDIIAKLKGIDDSKHAGFILLALPARPEDASRVYAGVKTQVRLPSKCFSTLKLQSQARRNRLHSYADGNALGMLVENGTRPWGLADGLVHEVHFGFDVARYRKAGLMGASVITDVAACDISFGYDEIDKREEIPTKIIGAFVLERLEDFFTANGRAPHRILFQRDGRLLDKELKGLRRAVRRFAEAHPDQPAPPWVAISIEKSTSVPLRLFREAPQGIARSFSGSYFLQNSRVGYLVTAGGPSLRQGTPRPIRVEVVASSPGAQPEIVEILEDIFRLSQLNWNSPEIDIKLPITLRFTDQKLERYALEVEEDDQDDWDEPEGESQELEE